jgi:hypothetical protein
VKKVEVVLFFVLSLNLSSPSLFSLPRSPPLFLVFEETLWARASPLSLEPLVSPSRARV